LVLPGHGLTQALAPGDEALRQRFMAEAERMRRAAVAAGDQSYGAVVAVSNEIVGWGPSRVVTDRNPAAHAERVAIGDAQARLGTRDLAGAILYSTSRPCSTCEAVAASAGISRMYWGPTGADAGVPRG
jgi:tRNA(adenine34) deaminase